LIKIYLSLYCKITKDAKSVTSQEVVAIMDPKELKKFKEQLIHLREELLSLVRKTTENEKEYPSSEVGDSIDQAADSSARELLFELNHTERQKLEDIDRALQKIEQGNFGICEKCGNKISKERLEAVPYAHFCVKCKARMEKPS
jgi:DnaK suppressor protein